MTFLNNTKFDQHVLLNVRTPATIHMEKVR